MASMPIINRVPCNFTPERGRCSDHVSVLRSLFETSQLGSSPSWSCGSKECFMEAASSAWDSVFSDSAAAPGDSAEICSSTESKRSEPYVLLKRTSSSASGLQLGFSESDSGGSPPSSAQSTPRTSLQTVARTVELRGTPTHTQTYQVAKNPTVTFVINNTSGKSNRVPLPDLQRIEKGESAASRSRTLKPRCS